MSIGAYKQDWRGGEVIPASWLRQTSKWLRNITSPDGSVLVSYWDSGINLTVAPSSGSGITSTDGSIVVSGRDLSLSTGATFNARIGVDETPQSLQPDTERSGGTVLFSLRRPRIAKVAGNNDIIQGSATQTSASLFAVSLAAVEVQPDTQVSAANIQMRTKQLNLDLSGNPGVMPTVLLSAATYGSWDTVLTIDTSAVDLGIQNRLSGNTIQTRMRQVYLTLTGPNPTIGLTAGTYGSWYSGAAASGFVCP